MCWMAAIPMAMSGVGALSGAMGDSQNNAAQIDQIHRQKTELVKQMLTKNADLTLQDRSNYEDTIAQMTENNLANVRNMGTLKAAVGESMLQGKSNDRLMRIAEGTYTRQNMSLNDRYERDYAKIIGEQVGNYASAKGQYDQLIASEPKNKSLLSADTLLNVGMSVGGAWAGSSLSGGLMNKTTGSAISKALGGLFSSNK